MNTQVTLSLPAQKVIDQFSHLAIAGKTIRCPYFNNKRSQVRAALRVLVGKGNPKDIVDELQIISLREKVDLTSLTESGLSSFAELHNIGIDCSGFVYYVLAAELQAKKGKSLRNALAFPYAKNPLRKLITLLRPVENTNVQVLSHAKNAVQVDAKHIVPGDLITMVGAGRYGNPDHVLLVTSVSRPRGEKTVITYAHSLKWQKDGPGVHGVRTGTITITTPSKPLTEQRWDEQEKTGEENETLKRARSSTTSVVRLRALSQ